ncbi:hypothetical protein OBBRIDRAFT_837740 [Obba rivulosa]|uniref:Uncharacterized protein n=1 Tax=Obba rivulosa TaxID=1052685 RepID=A0A8E2APG6_9APHY|nr:hypothetical protein OBBRIDRAFT_837740 [Obba rivulosa]
MSEIALEEIFDWADYEKDHPRVWIDEETYKRNEAIAWMKSILGMPLWPMFNYGRTLVTAVMAPWDASSGPMQPDPSSLSTTTTQENRKETKGVHFDHARGDNKAHIFDSEGSFNSGGQTPSPAPYTMHPTSSTMMQAAHAASTPIISNTTKSPTGDISQRPASLSPPSPESDFPVSGLRSTAACSPPTPSPPESPALLATSKASPSPAPSCSPTSDRAGPADGRSERPHVYAQEALMMTIMRMHYSQDAGAMSPVRVTPSLPEPSKTRRSSRHVAPPPKIPQTTTMLPHPTSQPRAQPSTKSKQGRSILPHPTKPDVHIDHVEGECEGGKQHLHGDDCVVVCRWMVDGEPCGHLITSEAAAFKHVQAHAILEGGLCKWIGCSEHLAGTSWRKHIVNIHCGYYKDQCPGCSKIVRRGLLPSRHSHCLEKLAAGGLGGVSGAGEHAGEGPGGHGEERQDEDEESDEEVQSRSRKRRTIDEDAGADAVKKRRKISAPNIID